MLVHCFVYPVRIHQNKAQREAALSWSYQGKRLMLSRYITDGHFL
jgi:hypothetical protein